MTWRTTRDVNEFASTAGAFLRSRPAENTVLLTVSETVRTVGAAAFGEPDPLFGWWHSADGRIGSAFLQTPPHPVLLTRSPGDAVTSLAAMLATLGRPLPGINLTDDAAEIFASEWRRHTRVKAEISRRMRLYRLGDLVAPSPAVSGSSRVAGPADRDLLLAWFESFGREVGEESSDLTKVVDARIEEGRLTLWQLNGAPVSMAGVTSPLAGVARVAPVYTPVELRRRGYAGAVTVAVSQVALDAGAGDVVLFTDLANPTSNALYVRLGYRPVHDRVVLSLA
ncbi:MAG TPA: GNAT family N-acetyltransferase [Streptosporangiaceae bacterium]|nr:GNAT family N-acetyltransferase [Streptosporangiaceae bacterium]